MTEATQRPLTHLTITSGHIARTTRAEVGDDVIALLRPLIRTEGGPLPGGLGWYLDLWWPLTETGERIPGAAVFQVASGRAGTDAGARPYVMAVACWREAAHETAWAQAQQLAQMMPPARTLTEPLPVPWLAVVVLPMAAALPPEQAAMLGDLERCICWALAEEDTV